MRYPTPLFVLPALALATALTITSFAVPAYAATAVDSPTELSAAFGATGSYEVHADIEDDSRTLTVPANAVVSLDLAGFDVIVQNVALGTGARLTITDSTDASGSFTADASLVPNTAAISTTGAWFTASGTANIVAKGGSKGAAIGGNFQQGGGTTKIQGAAVVLAKAGTGASAIGAGTDGQAGGSYSQSGTSIVTVASDAVGATAIGAMSSTGTINITSGQLIIAANSVLRLHFQPGDSASNAGTITVAGSLTGDPITNTGSIYATGGGIITSTVSGSSFELTFNAGSGTLDANSSVYEIFADSLYEVGMLLPTATWADHGFDGWKFGNVPFTATTDLPTLLGSAKTATVTAVWKDLAGVTVGIGNDHITYTTNPVLTATVTGATGGSVEFFAGTASLGSAQVINGTAQFTPFTPLAVGVYLITAKYSGSVAAGTSPSKLLVVSKGTTTTTLVPSHTEITLGDSVLLEATVNNVAATGTVTFYADGITLGTAALANGVATLGTTPAIAAKVYQLKATYPGDAGFTASQSSVSAFTITSAPAPTPTVTVTASPSPVPTVTVTASPSPAPTVTVTASPTPAPTVTQTVKEAAAASVDPTTTAAWVSSPTSTFGSVATVNAHVDGSATGTVTFISAGTVLGSSGLASGYASLPVAMLPAGTHAIVAIYSGDPKHTASSSKAASLTVVKATTKASVSAKKFKKGSKPKITVKLAKLKNGMIVTGKVALYVGKKKVKTVTVTKASTKVTLPKKYTKSITVTVKFLGSKNVVKVTSKAKKIAAK